MFRSVPGRARPAVSGCPRSRRLSPRSSLRISINGPFRQISFDLAPIYSCRPTIAGGRRRPSLCEAGRDARATLSPGGWRPGGWRPRGELERHRHSSITDHHGLERYCVLGQRVDYFIHRNRNGDFRLMQHHAAVKAPVASSDAEPELFLRKSWIAELRGGLMRAEAVRCGRHGWAGDAGRPRRT